MPPKKAKKGKGKKKKAANLDPNALTEVDKTFYDLTITDLNRKLARLRTVTEDLEQKNQELIAQNEKIDEDKSDIISYLKRVLQEKIDEIKELEERILALQETRTNETKEFEEKIADLENEYKEMRQQLVSENKLLTGKLNSLEEFRIQRDDLMKKFEEQENAMQQQEKKHTREIYEIERNAIIAKNNLKKNMEARLLQLSTEFHESLDLRISATTQKVIRENITINTELNRMLNIHQQLYKENQHFKSRDTELRHTAELHEMEKNQTLSNSRIQKKIIERITVKNEALQQELDKLKHYEQEVRQSKLDIKSYIDKNKQIDYKMKLLEQNLHKIKCENTSLKSELIYLTEDNMRLDDILFEGVCYIKDALAISTEHAAPIKATKREGFLHTLLTLLSKGHEKIVRRPSLDTISSAGAAYAQGDLGFMPKSSDPVRPLVTMKRHMYTQIDDSFEEYINDTDGAAIVKKSYADKTESELYLMSITSDTLLTEEQEEKIKVQSDIFFDETEMVVEEEVEESEDNEIDPFAVVSEMVSSSWKSVDKSSSLVDEKLKQISARGSKMGVEIMSPSSKPNVIASEVIEVNELHQDGADAIVDEQQPVQVEEATEENKEFDN